jgi:hypothetical protein
MFGITPAYGFFVRHARGITLESIELSFDGSELRPAFFLDDVEGIELSHTNADLVQGVKMIVLNKVLNFRFTGSRYADDIRLAKVDRREL